MSERETTLNFIASRLAPDTVRKRLPIWGFVAGSVILFLFAGCGTLKNGRSWGEDAFYPVDFKKISHAAFLNVSEEDRFSFVIFSFDGNAGAQLSFYF
ncbi:MAG: hypothetical protein KAS40_06860 [Desulfobacterales bacterium]|nr:hypothetical protein [Desulfobacterales bacterium]